MTDEQIIALYFNRDENAITESDRSYGAYCHSIAFRILTNESDSEECVNDTWMHAWNVMPPEHPNILRMFFAKITRNLSLDLYRRMHRQKRGGSQLDLAYEELEECISSKDDPEKALEAKELSASINQFLKSLPERECNLFLRRYFFLESAREIAERYHLKETNVQMILSRVRKKLRTHLQKEGYLT